MKKILFFALALMAGAAWAQEEQPVQKLNVHMMDGTVVSFLLDEEPVTKFEPGQLIIQTSGDAPIIYLIENVRKYTYEGRQRHGGVGRSARQDDSLHLFRGRQAACQPSGYRPPNDGTSYDRVPRR